MSEDLKQDSQNKQENKQQKPLHNKIFDEKPQRKGPKFNIYWVYVLILGALIFSAMYNGGMRLDAAKVTETEVVQNMLLPGDVEQMDIVKVKDIVRVTIKSDSIVKPYYLSLIHI